MAENISLTVIKAVEQGDSRDRKKEEQIAQTMKDDGGEEAEGRKTVGVFQVADRRKSYVVSE